MVIQVVLTASPKLQFTSFYCTSLEIFHTNIMLQ